MLVAILPERVHQHNQSFRRRERHIVSSFICKMAAAELQIPWVFPWESCYESAKAIQSPHPALKINEQTDNSIAKPAYVPEVTPPSPENTKKC